MKTKIKTNRSIKLNSRSFSPLLNNKLQIHSLKTLKPKTLQLCNSLLNLQIVKNNKKPVNLIIIPV